MLIGQYINQLTEKGRSALPKKFRDIIGETAIIAKWYEGCLVVVSKDRWEEIIARLTGKIEMITAPVRDTDRFILGSAFEVIFDKQGRFVIPKILREYAGLREESEIVFIGLGYRIEIWDKNLWDDRQKYIQEHAEEMVEKIAQINTERR